MKEGRQFTLDKYVTKNSETANEEEKEQPNKKTYNLRPRARPISRKKADQEQTDLESEEKHTSSWTQPFSRNE